MLCLRPEQSRHPHKIYWFHNRNNHLLPCLLRQTLASNHLRLPNLLRHNTDCNLPMGHHASLLSARCSAVYHLRAYDRAQRQGHQHRGCQDWVDSSGRRYYCNVLSELQDCAHSNGHGDCGGAYRPGAVYWWRRKNVWWFDCCCCCFGCYDYVRLFEALSGHEVEENFAWFLLSNPVFSL